MVRIGEHDRLVPLPVRRFGSARQKRPVSQMHPVKHAERDHRSIHTSSPYRWTFSTALCASTVPIPKNPSQ